MKQMQEMERAFQVRREPALNPNPKTPNPKP